MNIAQQLYAEARALWWAPWTADLSADLKRHAEAMAKARAAFTLIGTTKFPTVGSSGAEDFQGLEK